MSLEDQVCRLELAKRLKELGVKQECIFFWDKDGNLMEPTDPYKNPHIDFAAFTVAELGDILPSENLITRKRFNQKWNVWKILASEKEKSVEFEENNLADAMAKMLIYLITKGLVTP